MKVPPGAPGSSVDSNRCLPSPASASPYSSFTSYNLTSSSLHEPSYNSHQASQSHALRSHLTQSDHQQFRGLCRSPSDYPREQNNSLPCPTYESRANKRRATGSNDDYTAAEFARYHKHSRADSPGPSPRSEFVPSISALYGYHHNYPRPASRDIVPGRPSPSPEFCNSGSALIHHQLNVGYITRSARSSDLSVNSNITSQQYNYGYGPYTQANSSEMRDPRTQPGLAPLLTPSQCHRGGRVCNHDGRNSSIHRDVQYIGRLQPEVRVSTGDPSKSFSDAISPPCGIMRHTDNWMEKDQRSSSTLSSTLLPSPRTHRDSSSAHSGMRLPSIKFITHPEGSPEIVASDQTPNTNETSPCTVFGWQMPEPAAQSTSPALAPLSAMPAHTPVEATPASSSPPSSLASARRATSSAETEAPDFRTLKTVDRIRHRGAILAEAMGQTSSPGQLAVIGTETIECLFSNTGSCNVTTPDEHRSVILHFVGRNSKPAQCLKKKNFVGLTCRRHYQQLRYHGRNDSKRAYRCPWPVVQAALLEWMWDRVEARLKPVRWIITFTQSGLNEYVKTRKMINQRDIDHPGEPLPPIVVQDSRPKAQRRRGQLAWYRALYRCGWFERDYLSMNVVSGGERQYKTTQQCRNVLNAMLDLMIDARVGLGLAELSNVSELPDIQFLPCHEDLPIEQPAHRQHK